MPSGERIILENTIQKPFVAAASVTPHGAKIVYILKGPNLTYNF